MKRCYIYFFVFHKTLRISVYISIQLSALFFKKKREKEAEKNKILSRVGKSENLILQKRAKCVIIVTRRCDGIGRRAGLKIQSWQQGAGSTPATGTRTEPTVDTIISCRFVTFLPQNLCGSGDFSFVVEPPIENAPKTTKSSI